MNKAEENVIINISTEEIYQHPDNPRKDLGELTELSESIKKNGIMQNLTVIPGHWDDKGDWYEDGYTLIIGHRRFAASKLAEVPELPCRVVNMDKKAQVSTMLEENMQRADLTIWEQANGFQMMLDLGVTEDQIAEKTGFSKTTIRHRLNIAKLDQKELRKKELDDSFQLTLKDLYELEKVKDIKTRNKILKEASSSRDLVSRAQNAVSEAKRQENAKTISKELKKLGVEKAPAGTENEMYSGKWKTVLEIDLNKEVPKKIKLPKSDTPLYWLVRWRGLEVITKAPKEKRELSPWEIEQKEREKSRKQIKAILKESTARRKEFVQNIISGKIDPLKDETPAIRGTWEALVALGAYIRSSNLRKFFLPKSNEYECTEEERQEAQKKVDELSTLHQMLIALHYEMESTNEPFDWQMHFNQERGNALQKGYEVLKPYGWYFENQAEAAVIDGTHELYAQEKKNEQ